MDKRTVSKTVRGSCLCRFESCLRRQKKGDKVRKEKYKIVTNGAVTKCLECGHTVFNSFCRVTGFKCVCEIEKEKNFQECENSFQPGDVNVS